MPPALNERTPVARSEPVGLYLIIEAAAGNAGLEKLKAALNAATFASALVVSSGGRTLDATTARPFVDLIQAHNVAALIDDDAALARTLRADGVHLRACDTLEARVREAREILGARHIVGADAVSRHDAMMLGELGAEYVAFFGEEQGDFIGWWAEIFEVPCVAFNVAGPEAAAIMAQMGADFVAFALDPGCSAADAQDRARAFTAAIST